MSKDTFDGIPYDNFTDKEVIDKHASVEVTRAYWKSAEKTVVLKTLIGNPFLDSGSSKNFFDELKLIRLVNVHDNIIQFFGVSQGTPEGYRRLYEQAWDNDPASRPTIEQVRYSLDRMLGIDSSPPLPPPPRIPPIEDTPPEIPSKQPIPRQYSLQPPAKNVLSECKPTNNIREPDGSPTLNPPPKPKKPEKLDAPKIPPKPPGVIAASVPIHHPGITNQNQRFSYPINIHHSNDNANTSRRNTFTSSNVNNNAGVPQGPTTPLQSNTQSNFQNRTSSDPHVDADRNIVTPGRGMSGVSPQIPFRENNVGTSQAYVHSSPNTPPTFIVNEPTSANRNAVTNRAMAPNIPPNKPKRPIIQPQFVSTPLFNDPNQYVNSQQRQDQSTPVRQIDHTNQENFANRQSPSSSLQFPQHNQGIPSPQQKVQYNQPSDMTVPGLPSGQQFSGNFSNVDQRSPGIPSPQPHTQYQQSSNMVDPRLSSIQREVSASIQNPNQNILTMGAGIQQSLGPQFSSHQNFDQGITGSSRQEFFVSAQNQNPIIGPNSMASINNQPPNPTNQNPNIGPNSMANINNQPPNSTGPNFANFNSSPQFAVNNDQNFSPGVPYPRHEFSMPVQHQHQYGNIRGAYPAANFGNLNFQQYDGNNFNPNVDATNFNDRHSTSNYTDALSPGQPFPGIVNYNDTNQNFDPGNPSQLIPPPNQSYQDAQNSNIYNQQYAPSYAVSGQTGQPDNHYTEINSNYDSQQSYAQMPHYGSYVSQNQGSPDEHPGEKNSVKEGKDPQMEAHCQEIIERYNKEYENDHGYEIPDACNAGYHCGFGDERGLIYHLNIFGRANSAFKFGGNESLPLVLIAAKNCSGKKMITIFQCLKERNADFSVTSKSGKTAFHLLIDNKQLRKNIAEKETAAKFQAHIKKIVEFLVDNKCDINAKDNSDRTILSYCLTERYNHKELIPFISSLLKHGANPNLPAYVMSTNGKFHAPNALFLAVEFCWPVEVLTLLSSYKTNKDEVNNDGKNLLSLVGKGEKRKKQTDVSRWVLDNCKSK
ncbi:10473_t:CDS:2 [Acaulospora colombiana]|uniref:10473_t:CDS:1 n=1 Tax=Acaulospora colombiana TaxID=27376 RepID=A0ACA9KAI6_9GLOM|nr:10473_t:CDS:2 [Acaulospora colombiana]